MVAVGSPLAGLYLATLAMPHGAALWREAWFATIVGAAVAVALSRVLKAGDQG